MKTSQPAVIGLSSSSGIVFLIYAFFIAILTTSATTINADFNVGNETDHAALLSFKTMITHDPYGVLSSWNSSLHFCDWSGVSCGKRHRRVTVVRLVSRGLEGSLSPHVGNLSFLHILQLRNNSFQGTIPHELGRLSRLRLLGLDQNKFSGIIPSNISSCSNLGVLGVGWNKLVGSIPMEISFLSKLTFLLVDHNNLTGGIPPFLGNLTSMEVFSASHNMFGGSIPNTLGRWENITEFDVGSCKLQAGTIPHFIYNLSLLGNLSLPNNQFTGNLPLAIGAMLPNLEYLQLRDNQLTGPLPPSLSNCSKLRHLEVHDNIFSGKLTLDFAKLKNIEYITLGNNLFGSEDSDEMKFVDNLKNCSKLLILEFDLCNFQGVLPRSIGNLSDQLHFLSLEYNQLHGNLPSSIGNLIGLTALYVGDNKFTGEIPSAICELKLLEVARLAGNQFSGSIPDAIGNLSLLNSLHLDSNRLEGRIPSSLGNCLRLSDLSFYKNNLSGQIPKQLLQISSLSIALNLSRNNLFGSLPTEVGNLKMLSYLDLSDNKLSGNIPGSLSGCTSLSVLSLKNNLFQGMIPSSLSSLRGLLELDLSQNNLSGSIPRFLEQFSVQFVNLSFNDFEGQIPSKGVFANASAFSVLGNNKLCGGITELGLPKCKETKKHKKKFPLFVIVILIAFALFTILCFVYALFKKKTKGKMSHSSKDEQFLKVSYNQLLKATNSFSEANLIGNSGLSSVYKGILGNEGTIVAVKVLRVQNERAQRSFIRECEAWRNIRHRNLLKIITSCSSVDFQGNDFKALIYEYMPNGSLHDWLHSNGSTSRPNLLQTVNILNDVASALDYLHNHCLVTIVHGDLKPSNILLDGDMVAHVGDFGLTQFLGTNSNQNSSTGLKGTIGYAPPEYGLGSEMTTSGDVYSFGILLLEVMTRKRPTDNIFNEDLSLHKYAYMALPDHVTNVIDIELLNHHQDDVIAMENKIPNAEKIEECMDSLIKIGVSCSMDSPPERMNIKDVVHELHDILDLLQNF